MGHPANHCSSFGERGQHRQGRDQIGHGGHVHVYAPQGAALDGEPFQGRGQVAAHAGQYRQEINIPLDRLQIQVGDGDPAAGQSRRGPKIRGAGRIRFNIILAAPVALAAGQDKAPVGFPGEGNAKRGKHRQGDIHVRTGYQLPGDSDFHPLRGQRPD